MKVIHKSKQKHDELKKKVENEAKINQIFKSKFIVKFYKKFEDEDNYCLIFQFCKHGDLKGYMKNRPKGLAMNEVRDIGL